MAKLVKHPPVLKKYPMALPFTNVLDDFPPGFYTIKATGKIVRKKDPTKADTYRMYFEGVDEESGKQTYFKMVGPDFDLIECTIGFPMIAGEIFEVEIESFLLPKGDRYQNYVKSCTMSDELREKIERHQK